MQKAVIICVDDELVVLKALESQLSRIVDSSHSIELAQSGEEALELIEELLASSVIIPLVISDQIMPGIKGSELLRKIHTLLPSTIKILLTGQADANAVGYAVNHANLYRYMSKPWQQDDILLTVGEAIKSFYTQVKLEEQHIKLKYYAETLEQKVIERTAVISQQKDEIQKAHDKIQASIRYAGLLQKAFMSDIMPIKNLMTDFFVFNKPKDIVSGDFFWTKQIGKQLYVAVGDCTGHGVPAALITALGISFLNEICQDEKIITPNIVLNELRTKLKKALKQNNVNKPLQDGIDISLILINIQKKEMSFAGANTKIIIAHQDNTSNVASLIEIKGDLMPVGPFVKETDFSLFKTEIKLNDIVYLFSDGFESQFGGNNNSTLKSANFKKILESQQIYANMEVQKINLEKELISWKNNESQTDDILVIGLKI